MCANKTYAPHTDEIRAFRRETEYHEHSRRLNTIIMWKIVANVNHWTASFFELFENVFQNSNDLNSMLLIFEKKKTRYFNIGWLGTEFSKKIKIKSRAIEKFYKPII